jgi:hypothetical protein
MAYHQNKSQGPSATHEHSESMCCSTIKNWLAESGHTIDSGYRIAQQGTIKSKLIVETIAGDLIN